MVRKLLVAFAALLCSLIVLLFVALGWMIYQPIGGSRAMFWTLEDIVQKDPSHAVAYTRLYTAFDGLTAGNVQHYIAHRAAGALARLAGNKEAANEQENRARSHQPR
jgi:hypothetical protein